MTIRPRTNCPIQPIGLYNFTRGILSVEDEGCDIAEVRFDFQGEQTHLDLLIPFLPVLAVVAVVILVLR